MLDDIRFSLRSLARQRGLSLAAGLTLALGFGACTAVFTVLDAVMLRPLPYPDADKLVNIYRFDPPAVRYASVSTQDFEDIRDELRDVAALAGNLQTTFTVGSREGAWHVLGAGVTIDFFDVTGLRPQRGRWLDAADQSGDTNGVVISHRLWQEFFAGGDAAIGAQLELNGEPWTVVGIAPAELDYPLDHDVWVPLGHYHLPLQRGSNFISMSARLHDGVSDVQIQERLNVLARRFAAEFPQEHADLSLRVMTVQERLVAGVRGSLWMLMAAVSLVMLIVCANVANLLLSRMLARDRELATRAALGASPLRLARQTLIEALLLAAAGATAGLALAIAGIDLLIALQPRGLPRLAEIEIGPIAVVFLLAATAVAGIVCGWLPAWHARRKDVGTVLHGGTRASPDRGSSRFSRSLVVAQLALSMALLVAVGLLLTTIQRLGKIDPGFATDGLLTAMIALPAPQPPPGDREAALAQVARNAPFLDAVEERLRSLPGVTNVGFIDTPPLSGTNNFNGDVGVPGRSFEPGRRPTVEFRWISAGYFRAAGIPLLAGDDFSAGETDAEVAGGVVVNAALAQLIWPGETAVGRQIEAFGTTVVVRGVVGNVRQWSLDREPSPELYFPYRGVPAPNTAAIVVRTSVAPGTLAEPVRRAVAEIDAGVPVFDVRTMDEISRGGNARRTFALALLTVFAGMAVLIAAIGLYGVMAYAVVRRSREIGVRMALGAQRSRVLRDFLRDGMAITLLGIGIGALVASGFSRLLGGLVVGVESSAPGVYVATALILGIVALGASVGPAWRASRSAPVVALRDE